jgi:hypothetical protein
VIELRLRRAPFAPHLPLIGAARHTPAGTSRALVFDFGTTWVKRAAVTLIDGAIMRVTILPPIESPCRPVHAAESINLPALPPVAEQLNGMADMIAATWLAERDAGRTPDCHILVALACYVSGGEPIPGDLGCFGRLPSPGPALAKRLRRTLAAPVTVQLLHDASAAASFFAGANRTAVITCGTALGIGFPPPADGLRPLASRLEVQASL